MTRSQTRASKSPVCHSLNFFCDDENGCAFTTLVHGYRFHIIADQERLKSSTKKGREIEVQYKKLVKAAKERLEEQDNPDKVKRKIEQDAAEVHESKENHSDSQDSGQGSSLPSSPAGGSVDGDSAVDIAENDNEQDLQENDKDISHEGSDDPEQDMKNWMLSPFAQIFEDLNSSSDQQEEQTIQEWYSGPTYFYNLEIQNDVLKPIEIESQPDLEERIKALIPHIVLPKSLRELGIPWVSSNDAVVVSESNELDPYHPSRVRVGGKVSFVKFVDMTQPQPFKRELRLMKQLEKKGLHKKIRVPVVEGLVGFEDSKTEVMGFLMTNIEDPTPLTLMLDSDVIEDEREKWARETAKMVKALHDNGIVWGDAKADNFMVDRHGDLWIIDFGGSYTDGWVDPELMETVEGDNMGTEKIINALKDPEANTFDPEEDTKNHDQKDKSTTGSRRSGKKRTRDHDDSVSSRTHSPKRQRKR